MKYLSEFRLLNHNPLPGGKAEAATLNRVLTVVFVVIGAVALLIMVIAGFRYIFARGDAQKITDAKNMILYSIIGLVITALAATIVNVFLGRAT